MKIYEKNRARCKYKKWEEDYIVEFWGTFSSKSIAEHLGRTVRGIRYKANELGLGKMSEYAGLFSIIQLCDIFGLSKKTVSKWCDLYGLRYRTLWHKEESNLKRKYIEQDKLMKWLEENQDRFDSKKLAPYALGQEPEWLIEKRDKDLKNPNKKIIQNFRRQNYTTSQVNSIWNMKYLLNKTYREIAEWYGVSRGSIIYVIKSEKKRREQFAKENGKTGTAA